MISSNEISVIVQGPILSNTREVTDRIRKHLPDAELIISTWEGECVDDLSYEKVVFSVDPGSFIQERKTRSHNNMNRQIRSTKAGLAVATRKYCLKLRSDLLIEHTGFLKSFDLFPAVDSESCIFRHKIVVALLFSRLKVRNHPTPFHISDWFYFGFKEDIEKFFASITEVVEPDFTLYFERTKRKTPYGKHTGRFSPEQYFGYSCWSKYLGFETMIDAADVRPSLIEASRRFMVSNFIILDFESSGIWTQKYSSSRNELELGTEWFGYYSAYTYELEYKSLCDPNYVITKCDQEYLHKNKDYYITLWGVKKHWVRFKEKKGISALGDLIPFLINGSIFLLRWPFYRYQLYASSDGKK